MLSHGCNICKVLSPIAMITSNSAHLSAVGGEPAHGNKVSMDKDHPVKIMHSLHLYWADVAQIPVHVIPPSCA
jgi:uncharacterized protein YcfL